jgi:hypothetical protein
MRSLRSTLVLIVVLAEEIRFDKSRYLVKLVLVNRDEFLFVLAHRDDLHDVYVMIVGLGAFLALAVAFIARLKEDRVFLAAAIGQDKDVISDIYGRSCFLDITDLQQFPVRLMKMIVRYL